MAEYTRAELLDTISILHQTIDDKNEYIKELEAQVNKLESALDTVHDIEC